MAVVDKAVLQSERQSGTGGLQGVRWQREQEVKRLGSDPRPLLVSATDAARVLAIGRTTLYEIVKSGDLTPIHIRRCVRFSMYEITQYVESLTRGQARAA